MFRISVSKSECLYLSEHAVRPSTGRGRISWEMKYCRVPTRGSKSHNGCSAVLCVVLQRGWAPLLSAILGRTHLRRALRNVPQMTFIHRPASFGPSHFAHVVSRIRVEIDVVIMSHMQSCPHRCTGRAAHLRRPAVARASAHAPGGRPHYNVVITGSTKGIGLALARRHLYEGSVAFLLSSSVFSWKAAGGTRRCILHLTCFDPENIER
jgi:hypothetical protein